MRGFLLMAGVYNLAWGIFIYNFPDAFYSWLVEEKRVTVQLIIYQGAGTIVLGIMYILACLYPVRFWYFPLLGLISKMVGAAGVYFLIIDKTVTRHFIFHLLVNDLVWVVPLALITFRAFRLHKYHTYEKAAKMDRSGTKSGRHP